MRAGGAGLGLPISRRLVEAMGGTMEIDSAPERGTRVGLRLPFEAAPPPAPGPSASPERGDELPRDGRADILILVVDDIDTNRNVLDRLLSHSGYTVRGVASGAEALEAFAARRPDLILMDRAMPGMDGIETTRRIRALDGGRDVPIIFVTGGVMDGESDAFRDAGATDVVWKPFRYADLLGKVTHYLERARKD